MVTTPDDDDATESEGREPPTPIKIGKVRLPGIAPRIEDRRGE
ncbi:hypothetical protein [Mycobacterium sp.]|nr:hypothetical protein [Mycobacterium sp.]HKP41439.1 hypothetical protein [Mycobacterium sp.]